MKLALTRASRGLTLDFTIFIPDPDDANTLPNTTQIIKSVITLSHETLTYQPFTPICLILRSSLAFINKVNMHVTQDCLL